MGRCDFIVLHHYGYGCQAYKALADAESAAKEAELEKRTSLALEEYFVRSEPLGMDRHYRRYWKLRGDNRLWVETRDEAVGGDGQRATPGSALFKGASEQLLWRTRPSSWRPRWSVYETPGDIWALKEALDDRGERERALKKAVESRFDLEACEAQAQGQEEQPLYERQGSEHLGKLVIRNFHRVRVLLQPCFASC